MSNQFSSYDVPSYLRENAGAGGDAFMQGNGGNNFSAPQGEKRMVAVDVEQFVRTRDAVSYLLEQCDFCVLCKTDVQRSTKPRIRMMEKVLTRL